MLNNPEQDRRISRRSFIQGVTAGFILAFAPDLLTSVAAQTRKWILAKDMPPQSKQWFPRDPDIAIAKGLITTDGPAFIYDKLHSAFLGGESNLQYTSRKDAEDYLEKYPDSAEWAGYCHGTAHLGLGRRILAEPETFTLPSGEKVLVTEDDRWGIGALWESGSLMNRPFLGDGPRVDSSKFLEENLEWFMDRFDDRRIPFIINAPKPGQSGSWYRVVFGMSTDRLILLATNLRDPKETFIDVPARPWRLGEGGVKEIYEPVLQDAGRALGLDERLFAEIPPGWRYDHLMDEGLKNRILYGI